MISRTLSVVFVVALSYVHTLITPTRPEISVPQVTSELIVGSLNVNTNPMVTMLTEQYVGGQWVLVSGGFESLGPGQIKRKVLPENQRIVITFNQLDPVPGPTP